MAAEEHGVREFLGNARRDLAEFFHDIGADGIVALGIVAVRLDVGDVPVEVFEAMRAKAFDFAGDTAIFVAIKDDAQNPIFKARVATIIMPVRADDCPACSCARILRPTVPFRRAEMPE